MKIAAISDMHGNLHFEIESSDILLICGDIIPLSIQDYHKPSKKWFETTFLDWCKQQPVEEIFLIGGNHDKWMYNHPEEVRECTRGTNIHYLLDETATYIDANGKDYKIYGSPWCHMFGNWSFMGYSDEKLEEIFSKMPENLDILITHDPPYGHNDTSDAYWSTPDEHLGNKALANVISNKCPRFVFSGHIHSGSKEFSQIGKTNICNVSVLDESYSLHYPPKYVEL